MTNNNNCAWCEKPFPMKPVIYHVRNVNALHATLSYRGITYYGHFDSWTCFQQWSENKVLPEMAIGVLAGDV
jgi:hypothetical protein